MIGVIDIGSKSLRLVLYDRLNRAPVVLFNEKVMCALGRGLDATGRLTPDGVALARENIERFVLLTRRLGVKRLDILATSAVRDATDGPAFVAEIEARCGIGIKVIGRHSRGPAFGPGRARRDSGCRRADRRFGRWQRRVGGDRADAVRLRDQPADRAAAPSSKIRATRPSHMPRSTGRSSRYRGWGRVRASRSMRWADRGGRWRGSIWNRRSIRST